MQAPVTNAVVFCLDVTTAGTKISNGGDNVVNWSEGLTCHQPAAKLAFICRKEHVCAPIPLDDHRSPSFRRQPLVCKDASHAADK